MTNDGGSKIKTVDKEDIINLLKGIGVPYGGIPGLSRYTGCQWNEDWEWDLDVLRGMSEAELLDLYCCLKEVESDRNR